MNKLTLLFVAIIFVATRVGTPFALADQPCFDNSRDRAAEIDKRIENCLRVLGDSMLGSDVRAEAYLRRALAYAQKAELSNNQNDINRAIADLTEGLRLDPKNGDAERYVLLMRAGLYFHKGETHRAIVDYTRLLRLEPNSAIIYSYRGTLFANNGNFDYAIMDFTEAIRQDPKSSQFYNQRALSYLQAGKPAEALADADRAVALAPDDAATYAPRVVINRAAGKTAEVIGDLRKALSLDPSNELIKNELKSAEAEQPAPVERLSEAVPSAATAPAPSPAATSDPNAAARRDYELAERVGTRDVWEAYLKLYQTGFYADLARAQLGKLGGPGQPDTAKAERERLERERVAQAERNRIEKERLAREQTERERAAKEQANKERLAREEAEQARLATERVERARLEKERVVREKAEREEAARAEAERKRLADEKAAQEKTQRELAAQAEKEHEREAARQAEKERIERERVAREQADRERSEKQRLAREQAAAEHSAKEQAEREGQEKERVAREQGQRERQEKERLAREQAEKERQDKEQAAKQQAAEERQSAEAASGLKTAELTPPKDNIAPDSSPASGKDALVREIKKELKRVGCYSGAVDDNWPSARASTRKFIRAAHVASAPDQPSTEFLDLVRGKSEHLCPLECKKGETESGGKCVAKTCSSGYQLDEDGDCVRQKRPDKSASRSPEALPSAEKPRSEKPAAEDRRQFEKPAPPPGAFGRCGATSCSAALRGCMRKCSYAGGGNCEGCSAKYSYCLQTGTFLGKFCQLTGLARN